MSERPSLDALVGALPEPKRSEADTMIRALIAMLAPPAPVKKPRARPRPPIELPEGTTGRDLDRMRGELGRRGIK